jgi:uncharacterized protein (TIGR03066 family)
MRHEHAIIFIISFRPVASPRHPPRLPEFGNAAVDHKESIMKALSVAVLGVMMAVFAGSARAEDDNAKKIVGTWELTKAGSDLPVGTTVEFTKDLKLTAIIKDGKDEKVTGTYKIDKDKISVKVTVNGQMLEEKTATIKKLTDDALEIEDDDKKIDVFKKKK